MRRLEIHPATAERWDDLRAVLNPAGNPQTCWCLAYRLSSGEFGHMDGAVREARMRALVDADSAPGVLAYVDGEVAGWCNVGPRAAMERLVRSRTILPVDDTPVWSVVCFVVRTNYRRQGIAEELLHGASEYACQHGAPAIAGFRRLAETDTKSARLSRWIYRRDL